MHPHSFAYGFSSCLATVSKCTISGPSAMRRLLAPANQWARGESWLTPSPPWSWIARSTTRHAICATATLIAAIWWVACRKEEVWQHCWHGMTADYRRTKTLNRQTFAPPFWRPWFHCSQWHVQPSVPGVWLGLSPCEIQRQPPSLFAGQRE